MRTTWTVSLMVLGLASVGAAQDEMTPEEEACHAAIESGVWNDVITACEPAVGTLDESHPAWEGFKQNLDYAYSTVCQEAAQAGTWPNRSPRSNGS